MVLVLALTYVLVRIVMVSAATVRVVAAVVVVVIALAIATAAVVHVGTLDAINAAVLSALHHVGPFATVPTVVVPGLSALQISTSIRLSTSVVTIVLLVVIIMMVSVPVRRLLLLLLMRRVIVLVLVMVVLVILRIAISHGIVSGRCCCCYRAAAVHQMIRVACAIVQCICSVCGAGVPRGDHNFLVVSRVVPLQVRLLRGLLLWVQLLIEITIIKMWIAAEQCRGLGGRSRRRLRGSPGSSRRSGHSHAHIVQKVQTVMRGCGGCGWNCLLLLTLRRLLLLMVVSGMMMRDGVVMGLRRRCRHRVPQLALQNRKLVHQRVHIREQHLASVGRPATATAATMLRATD